MSELKFLNTLEESFSKLPGVGKKTAERYAYYVVEKMSQEDVDLFSKELIDAKKNIKYCSICNMLTNKDMCDICASAIRDKKTIMVVRDTKDVLAIEKTHQYNGLYHVLGGLISPLDGVSPDDLAIDLLEKRLGQIDELIIATSFTPNGETTALYLEKVLAKDNLKISRIGYGLPTGVDLEYVDELTLKRSIDSRK